MSKMFQALLCAMVVATVASAATPAEVEAWKKSFPVMSKAEPAALRELESGYQWLVKQATPANIERTLRMLHEKADKDIESAGELARSSRSRTDAGRKLTWLNKKMLPFIARAPR